MYIHLIEDRKFAGSEIRVFEKFYPNQSLYILGDKWQYRHSDIEGINYIRIKKHSACKTIDRYIHDKVDCVLVYCASYTHQRIALYLKERYGAKLYWMLFGGELYNILNIKFGYQLIDDKSIIPLKNKLYLRLLSYVNYPLFRRFIKELDSFCFWDIYDLKLIKRYFDADHVNYRLYTHDNGLEIMGNEPHFVESDNYKILINHSAGLMGNHFTILKKIEEMDINRELHLLIPLSYNLPGIKTKLEKYLSKTNLNYKTLTELMSPEDYFKIISQYGVMIIGTRRQAAGGNIFSALKNGTKVFLRNDNNIMQLIRDWGGHVFSFEDDLNSLEDLVRPLTLQQKIDNYNVLNNISCSKVAESMKHFFD